MKYLNSLNHYRALSIVLIVASHSFAISDVVVDTFGENVIMNLIRGCTINFVFISGFLFHAVFYNRFNYKKFINSKTKRVLLPYLFLSILPIIIRLYLNPRHWLAQGEIETFYTFIISAFKYIISGSHLIAYWYIPFIILVFAVSPLHIRFIELKLKYQIITICILFAISIILQRPYERIMLLQAFQSLIYFTPIYLTGIICSIHKEYIYKLFRKREFVLLGAGIGFAIIQASIGHQGNYMNDLFNFQWNIDLIFIQKFFMCLFFMVWLDRFENLNNRYVDTLAKFSFPVFFLHGYILGVFIILKEYLNITFSYPWLMFMVFVSLLILISIAMAKVVVLIFPRHSLMLIGYGKKQSKISKEIKSPKILVFCNLEGQSQS